jgi:FtsH-binding integral membrane protein
MIPSPMYAQPHPSQVAQSEATFMRKVYAYMTAGLAITALTSFLISHSPTMLNLIFGNHFVFFGLLIAELLMVVAFTKMIPRMSVGDAATLLFCYSVVNGLTLSMIFLIYTGASIAQTFFVAAGTFAGMSVYGYTTKRDLTGVGHFAIMALWGLIVASIVNLFLRSPAFYWLTTYAGVLIFVALTAYDTQKIKGLNTLGPDGSEVQTKGAMQGALLLYLDFVNLFLYLLRIFGRRR